MTQLFQWQALQRAIICGLLMLTASGLRADTFRLLDDETEALQCRIDLIQQAESEILLSYYILIDDQVGSCLLELLREAAIQRGVKVRIIMDKNASSIKNPKLSILNDFSIEIREFRVSKWVYLRRYTHRLHDKFMVVDDKWVIAGGRNVKGEYYNLGAKFNFLDREVLVSGKGVCNEARKHFYTIWNSPLLSEKAQTSLVFQSAKTEAAISLKNAQSILASQIPVHFNTGRDWAIGAAQTAQPIVFIHDDFQKKKGDIYEDTYHKDLGSTTALLEIIDSAKYSIFLENPYFNPTKKWLSALQRALDRGVKIRLLTNSLYSTDLPIREASYLNRRRKFLKMGIEVWEYYGEKKLHSKSMIIDEKVSIVGSYNLHYLSEQNNSEVAVCVVDTVVAKQHLQIMERNIQQSARIGHKNRRIVEHSGSLPSASPLRKSLTFLMRYTIAWMPGKIF